MSEHLHIPWEQSVTNTYLETSQTSKVKRFVECRYFFCKSLRLFSSIIVYTANLTCLIRLFPAIMPSVFDILSEAQMIYVKLAPESLN